MNGLLYQGMLILTVSASVPLIVDVPSNSGVRRVAVYLGLYLVALGTGGVKPCSSALGADQFDGTDPVERATKGSFNWYYWIRALARAACASACGAASHGSSAVPP